jgi:hypothetical protein
MENRDVITKYLKDYRARVEELVNLFTNKTINAEVFKLNMIEDVNDLEVILNHMIQNIGADG